MTSVMTPAPEPSDHADRARVEARNLRAQLWMRAHHGAAHAVIGTLFGKRVTGVEVWGGPPVGGRTELAAPGDDEAAAPGPASSPDAHATLRQIVYLLAGLLSGHLRRDLLPAAAELATRRVLAEVWNHVRLRRARGAAARHYNVLQKLAYVAVIFVLLPVMALSGLTMSPAVTAALPFLLDLFGGRQSARTIHFLVTDLLVLFVLVHVVQVIVTGAFNNMRAMITGRYVIRPQAGP